MKPRRSESLLCVANFPSDTGYAWRLIGDLWTGLARMASDRGVRTFVAYPASRSGRTHEFLQPVELDATCRTLSSVVRTLAFCATEKVRYVYFSDRPAVHWSYPLLRTAGVRRIVVHDHTSGDRTAPRGPRRWLKWAAARLPGMTADRVIAVSDFVRRRQIAVGQVPQDRVERIWNGVQPIVEMPDPQTVWRELGLDDHTPLVVCASRAAAEKGIKELLQAFDEVVSTWREGQPPALVYLGDGPETASLRNLAASLSSSRLIHIVGYRNLPAPYFAAATVCVYPSLWAEAFGLGVLEPMSMARPVIATRVGGIPEIVEDGLSGILVPPGDVAALAIALRSLLLNADLRRRLGEAGRARALTHFRLSDTVAGVCRAVLLEDM